MRSAAQAAEAAWTLSTSRKGRGKRVGGGGDDDGAAGVVGATFVSAAVPRAGVGGGGGGGGGAAPFKAPRVTRAMVHREAGLNVLEGVELWPRFVTPAQEAQIVSAVDAALTSYQRGGAGGASGARAATFRASRTGADAATLRFGAAVDAAGALASGGTVRAVELARLVDPAPPALMEVARRVATLGREELTLPPGLRGEDLCVVTAHVAEPGMHVPPMRPIADADAFHEPVLVLALWGGGGGGGKGGGGGGSGAAAGGGGGAADAGEQLLFGQRITPAGDDGDGSDGAYDAAFALTVHRRALLNLRSPTATEVQVAVPATAGRLVLLVFRWPRAELRAQLVSRGNVPA